MTFDEWYKETYPDMDPRYDDFLQDLWKCWCSAYREGLVARIEDEYETKTMNKLYKKETE